MTLDIDDLRRHAANGSVVAQSVLGIACLEGIGCAPDYSEAFVWLSAAAEKRAPRAMVNLGRMYEHGQGVPPDPGRALELYRGGALGGEFFGCIYLARLLASGKLGSVDEHAAVHWYGEALAQALVNDSPEHHEAQAYVAAHGGRS